MKVGIIRITVITIPTVSLLLMPIASGRVQMRAKGTTMNVVVKIRYIKAILTCQGVRRTLSMTCFGNAFRNFGLDLTQKGTPTVAITIKMIAILTETRTFDSSSRVQSTPIGIADATPFNKKKLTMKPNVPQIFSAIKRVLRTTHLQIPVMMVLSRLAIDRKTRSIGSARGCTG